MKRIFEFIKVGETWFYWWPDFIGDVMELSMVDGADKLLDSLGNKYVKVQVVSPNAAEIILSKIDEDEQGATYMCRSKHYNDKLWLCPVTLMVFPDEVYPENIYLRNIK